MPTTRNVLLINGSLRARSTTAAALRTALLDPPPQCSLDPYDGLGALPHFNPDHDHAPLPPAVADLRGRIHRAGALVLSVPEYAGALPGVLKNLLDWTIGDDEPGSINGKPVAWINVAPRGAAGAHAELRTVLTYAGATIIDAACINLPTTTDMLGPGGAISDPAALPAIRRALTTLVGA